MPRWEWFAFDSRAAAIAILEPAQKAVRDRNLESWQRIFDQLTRTHPAPHLSASPFLPNAIPIVEPGRNELARDRIPAESDFALRRALQMLVEHSSRLRLSGTFPRARYWVLGEVRWAAILSKPELEEMGLFQQIITGSARVPDPYWCLASNSAVDSNYVDPELVLRMSELEEEHALFRTLVRRDDLGVEVAALARDLHAAALLMQLAAAQGLAVFFREDGT